VVTIEADGLIVLGIDDKRVDRELRAQGAHRGVPQEGAAELPPTIGSVDSEAAQPRNGYRRITGKSLGEVLRQIGQGDASRGEGVIPRNLGRSYVEPNITGGCPAAYVLSYLLAKIAIEGLNAA